MNLDIKKVLSLIEDLTRIREENVCPQNFDVYLAKNSTEDKKLSKLPTKAGTQPPRHTSLSISESRGQSSSAEVSRRNIRSADNSSIPRSRFQGDSSRHQYKSVKTVPETVTLPSFPHKVPNSAKGITGNVLTRENAHSPETPKTRHTREVTAEDDSSNLQLTPVERNALIFTIIEQESNLQSILKEQEEAIFSSPPAKVNPRPKTPTKPSVSERDDILATLRSKRLEIESFRAAQEKSIFSSLSPEARRKFVEKAAVPPPDRSRPKIINNRQRKFGKKRSLTPIPEVREVPVRDDQNEHDRSGRLSGQPIDSFIHNANLKAIRAKEYLRQQQMETELAGGLIQDTDESMLVRSSDESDSFNELVIKDFVLHVAPSDTDAAISALPITEQAIIESNKLKDTIESIKNRFQIKVARDKYMEQREQKVEVPEKQKVRITEKQKVIDRRLRTLPNQETPKSRNPYFDSLKRHFKTNENSNPVTIAMPPVNIIDSENWGNVVLPEPITAHCSVPVPTPVTSSEEDFLQEKDMQFDDIFGADNVAKSLTPTKQTQHQHNIGPSPQQAHIENIEDFENPRLSDLSSDESDQTSAQRHIENNLDVSGNIEDMEDPQFHSELSSDEIINVSAFQSPNRITSAGEIQNELNIQRLKELLSNEALTSSITNLTIEEEVLNLLLRQSNILRNQATLEKDNESNLDVSENIEDFEDPQFYSETSSDEMVNGSTEQSNNEFGKQIIGEQPHNKIMSTGESQYERDMERLKKLLASGALASSITNQRFEEGVLDLLLRQSDSLWDPIVKGIPISFFLPSQNHGRGLLDTSINEPNLDQPLIKEPQKTLTDYLHLLENEFALNSKESIEQEDDVDMNKSNQRVENELIKGLPNFSYEPVQPFLYRKKVHNIMDSEDEPEDSDGILEDDEMNFDELAKNTATPTYDFKKGNVLNLLQRKMKNLRMFKDPRDVFNDNAKHFEGIFGFDGAVPTHENYVPSADIDLLYKQMPSIDSQIFRNVENCQQHIHLMKSIYQKMKKYISQPEQPQSSQTYEYFEEILRRFNKITDGRICARIESCRVEKSLQSTKTHDTPVKKDVPALERSNQAENKRPAHIQNNQANEHQQTEQANTQKPIKIRKSVSFLEKTPPSKATKSVQTKYTSSGKAGRSKAEPITTVRKSGNAQKKLPIGTAGTDDDQFKEWISLDINDVRDMIQHARIVQARKNRKSVSANQRTVKGKR